jgi:hypothetical protein
VEEEGQTMSDHEECNCDQALELKQATEEILPLVQEILRLGTKEGRERYVMMGPMGAARLLQMAQQIVDNSPWWGERLAFDENTPIEAIDHMLRKEGIDPEELKDTAKTLKTSIKMAGAARRGLVRSMVLSMNEAVVSEERDWQEFAHALAKREGVKIRLNQKGRRSVLEVETDEGWES